MLLCLIIGEEGGVGGPGDVIWDVNSQKPVVFNSLHRGAFDGEWCVGGAGVSGAPSQLFSFAHVQWQVGLTALNLISVYWLVVVVDELLLSQNYFLKILAILHLNELQGTSQQATDMYPWQSEWSYHCQPISKTLNPNWSKNAGWPALSY